MHVLLVSAVVYAALLALFLGWFHRQVAASPSSPRHQRRLRLVRATPQQRMAGHANQACPAALWERHDQAWAEYLSAPVGSLAKAYAFERWQEIGKLAMRAEAQARHASLDAGVRP